ncbi:MAG: hypothetical protein WA985_03665 [Erythrobacter sp.]|uniref:hypothetical protein n=1 Tax=Erythrobacter sp. TaxID=1042 RepID=UPI003C737B23
MTKTLPRIMVSAAAAGLAFAPIAAQANTRAATAPVYAQQGTAQPGTQRDDDDDDSSGFFALPAAFLALFGAAATAGLITVVVDGEEVEDIDNGFDQSPGT